MFRHGNMPHSPEPQYPLPFRIAPKPPWCKRIKRRGVRRLPRLTLSSVEQRLSDGEILLCKFIHPLVFLQNRRLFFYVFYVWKRFLFVKTFPDGCVIWLHSSRNHRFPLFSDVSLFSANSQKITLLSLTVTLFFPNFAAENSPSS